MKKWNRSLGNNSLLTITHLDVSLDNVHWLSRNWVNVLVVLGVHVSEWVLSVLLVGNILSKSLWLLGVSLNDIDWLSGDWINVLVVLGVDMSEWILSVLLVGDVLSESVWLLSITLNNVYWLPGNWVNVFVVFGVDMSEWVLSILLVGDVGGLNKLFVISDLEHGISLDHVFALEVEHLLLVESSWHLSWLGSWWWHDSSGLWLFLFLVLFFILHDELEWTAVSVVILTLLSSLLEGLESGELVVTIAHLLSLLEELRVLPNWCLVTQEFFGTDQAEKCHDSNRFHFYIYRLFNSRTLR